ncbi:hypothetical protein Rhein_1115 [Rheinheimera sp. A13L]|nr:hypothetical protein Rhein_1115 [Rheinheimera sp. A13L]
MESILKIVIFIMAICLFCCGAYFSLIDQVAAATATYGAAILALIFAFLTEFKTFKGLGIEAELLDRKIEEADDLISRLRGITIPIAEMLLSSTARMGRLGTIMPRRQRYGLLNQIERELQKCGVSLEQLEAAKVDWHFFNTFDLATPIFQQLIKVLKNRQSEHQEKFKGFGTITPDKYEAHEALCKRNGEIHKEIEFIKDMWQQRDQTKMVESVKNFIVSSTVLLDSDRAELSGALKEELLDLEHYIQSKQFRRPDVWFESDDSL